jgi:hypothetical protein
MRASVGFLYFRLKIFTLAGRRHGIWIPALNPLCIFYYFYYLLHPSTQKKRWRCRDDVTRRRLKSSGQKQKLQVATLFYLSRHDGFQELATKHFERLNKFHSSDLPCKRSGSSVDDDRVPSMMQTDHSCSILPSTRFDLSLPACTLLQMERPSCVGRQMCRL